MRNKHSKRGAGMRKLAAGRQELLGWVWTNKRFIGFCVALLLLYITHSNAVRSAARRQHALRDSLSSARAQAMAAQAEYMRASSLPAVKKELSRFGSAVAESDAPPIILEED
jgi:hypothetical protein